MLSLLRRVASSFAVAGAAVALGAALMVVTSITLRALTTRPIPGDVELTQFAIALAISLSLPWCQLHHANIDFFTQKMAPRRIRLLDGIGALMIGAMCALLAWRTGVGAISVSGSGDTSMILGLPMWWVYVSLAPGLALAALIAFVQAAMHFADAPMHALDGSAP